MRDEAAVEPEWEGGEGDEAEGAGNLNEPAEAVGMMVAKKREVAREGVKGRAGRGRGAR